MKTENHSLYEMSCVISRGFFLFFFPPLREPSRLFHFNKFKFVPFFLDSPAPFCPIDAAFSFFPPSFLFFSFFLLICQTRRRRPFPRNGKQKVHCKNKGTFYSARVFLCARRPAPASSNPPIILRLWARDSRKRHKVVIGLRRLRPKPPTVGDACQNIRPPHQGC